MLPILKTANKKNRLRLCLLLYEKEIDLGRGKTRTIRFFSKDVPDDSIPTTLPEDYEVKINKKTGVPYLRKKQK